MTRARPVSIHSTRQLAFQGIANLAQGFVVMPDIGTTGGSSKDHPELQAVATRAINKAHYVLRITCAPILTGTYFIPYPEWGDLDKNFREIRIAAQAANVIAKETGSDLRTRAEIFPLPIDPSNTRFALRVAQSIYWRLVSIRETFESGDPALFITRFRESKNLYKLVTDDQARLIRSALSSAENQRPLMLAIAKDRPTPKELDYSEIDRAIEVFAPAADSFLSPKT